MDENALFPVLLERERERESRGRERMDLSGHEGEIPFPIPIPKNMSYMHDNPSTNGPPTPNSLSTSTIIPYNSKKEVVMVKYRECLKNHAASIGGNATDGCGEFMPSGEDGSLEALKCSACNCHRNFHRKEAEGEESHRDFFRGPMQVMATHNHKGVLIHGSDSFAPLIMPLGAAAMQTSESDELARPPPPFAAKKRFRTKFTSEQKEKMLGFAESAGWRLQRQEEGVVQQFCQEIGVKRRVLKVWMHNNKHNLAKKELNPA